MDNYSFIMISSSNSVKLKNQSESNLKIQLIQITLINNEYKWDNIHLDVIDFFSLYKWQILLITTLRLSKRNAHHHIKSIKPLESFK